MVGLYDRDELVLPQDDLERGAFRLSSSTLVTLVVVFAEGAVETDRPGSFALFVFWGLLRHDVERSRAARRLAGRQRPPNGACWWVTCRTPRASSDCSPPSRRFTRSWWHVIPFDRVTSRGEDAEAFGDYLASSDFHRVIVTHTDHGFGEMLETIRLFKSKGIKVSVLPGLFEVLGSAVEFDDISGSTLSASAATGSRAPRAL